VRCSRPLVSCFLVRFALLGCRSLEGGRLRPRGLCFVSFGFHLGLNISCLTPLNTYPWSPASTQKSPMPSQSVLSPPYTAQARLRRNQSRKECSKTTCYGTTSMFFRLCPALSVGQFLLVLLWWFGHSPFEGYIWYRCLGMSGLVVLCPRDLKGF